MRRSDEKPPLVADVRNLRRVEHDVARILAETERPVEAYEATLEAIGRPLGWRLGAVWELDSLDGRLRCVRTWHAERPAAEFEAPSEGLAPDPGEELPARGGGSPQRPACGLRVPGARPARPRRRHGVLRGELREPDERLLATMGVLGTQLGQFVARR